MSNSCSPPPSRRRCLPTILSRCQRFDLRRIPAALIVKHLLASIAGKENVKIDEAALHAIARGADGGMRDAESTLDQLISFCGSEIAEADVLSMFGLASPAARFWPWRRGAGGRSRAGPAPAQRPGSARQGHRAPGVGVAGLFSQFAHFSGLQRRLALIEASEAEAAALASAIRRPAGPATP
jgi:hypothetical protein